VIDPKVLTVFVTTFGSIYEDKALALDVSLDDPSFLSIDREERMDLSAG